MLGFKFLKFFLDIWIDIVNNFLNSYFINF